MAGRLERLVSIKTKKIILNLIAIMKEVYKKNNTTFLTQPFYEVQILQRGSSLFRNYEVSQGLFSLLCHHYFLQFKKKILNAYWGIVNILPDFCYIFIRRGLFLVSLNRVKILNKYINKLLNNTWKLIVGCLGILKGLEMKNSQESLHNKTTEKRTHNYHSNFNVYLSQSHQLLLEPFILVLALII